MAAIKSKFKNERQKKSPQMIYNIIFAMDCNFAQPRKIFHLDNLPPINQ